jgi:glyoxylase-like metal-dependent hydrolase (beta-lactamase superfamily II)
MFLAELGRRAFAVTILGGVIAGCSDDDDPPTTAPDSTTTTSAAREPLEWERVSLGFVSAYVLVRGREAAVVDTGTAGSEAAIAEALSTVGVGWDAVDHVVLTHMHPDHAGSVGAVLESATGATAYAGEADIPSIQSPRPLEAVGDGEEVFGLQMIATPGHTLGHIAVFDPDSGLLIAGDALTRSGTGVAGSNPSFTADVDQAEASVRKLAALEFDTMLVGHGDPIEGSAKQAVAAFAETL